MKMFAKAALGAFMLAASAAAAPACAQVGISFGFDDGFSGLDSCDYYDYYDQAPPWGLPDDYCDYPVFSSRCSSTASGIAARSTIAGRMAIASSG
jgi:hypothetical protein